MGAGVGVGDEIGREVSKMIGGVVLAFPPKLITLSGPELGTGDGELRPFDERKDINDEACSGERVVVVGGRVSVGRVVATGGVWLLTLLP
jgi:hypothetical protein